MCEGNVYYTHMTQNIKMLLVTQPGYSPRNAQSELRELFSTVKMSLGIPCNVKGIYPRVRGIYPGGSLIIKRGHLPQGQRVFTPG